jgi:AraC-like DNA-binding protein
MRLAWPVLSNFRVGHGGVAVYPAGATFGPRRLADYEFVWIIEGGAVARFNGEAIDAPPGTILLSRPGMTDRYEWAERARTVHAFFHFHCDAPPAPWPPPSTWPLAQPAPPDDVLRPLFRYVLAALTQPEPLRSTLLTPSAELILRSFVAGKLGLVAEPRTELPLPVEKAMEFIREAARRDPAPAVALTDLARAAHVSAEHLCRLFRRSLNLAPLECLRLARLERAATLVGRSNLTFKEIAETTGFANPFHFSMAFKAIYGLPPRRYRLAVSEGRAVPANPLLRNLQLPAP